MPKQAKVKECKFEVGEEVGVKEFPRGKIEAIGRDEAYWDGWRIEVMVNGQRHALAQRFLKKYKKA